jgi:adenylate cyclase
MIAFCVASSTFRGYAEDDNRMAHELFERAISLDPRFALANAYLALTILIEHGFNNAPQPIKDRALALALTSLRLDPDDGRCYQFLAQTYLYRGEFDMALFHFEHSITLNSNDANGLAQMGAALAFLGRPEEGIDQIRQAMRLNPFHPQWYWGDLAAALYGARRYEEAVNANRRLAGHGNPWYLARLAACYAQLARMDEPRAQAASTAAEAGL